MSVLFVTILLVCLSGRSLGLQTLQASGIRSVEMAPWRTGGQLATRFRFVATLISLQLGLSHSPCFIAIAVCLCARIPFL